MKTTTKVLIFLFIFLSVSIGFSGTFFDDFSDSGKSKDIWEVVHRDWKIKDGYYWAPGQDGLKTVPLTLLPIKAEDGMVIEAQCGDAGDGNWQNFAVVYSYEDEDEAYTAGAGVGNKQWRFFQLTPKTAAKGGGWGADIVPGLATKKPLEGKEWYNIRIEIKGTEIFLFGDSKPEGKNLKEKHVFKKKTAPRGRLGLAAAGASPMFNHIKITGRNVENLFPVSPRDKLGTTWGRIKQAHSF